eukprot:TRINITY_DN9673_c0_g1_i1.p2 TRINITY_DN9673_c0_g1~~TRINITY_DN9673_c0_g1_i1.p2  ORF type:complete len:125 (+),score=30.72 TRINITY_DN9673_c0_g1_i1:145-519(+)
MCIRDSLSPLQDVYDVSEGFLWGCSGLTELDLTPLSNLQEFPKNFFLAGCGFTTLDLSPLTKVRKLSELFLFNNKSLTTIILPPSITKVLSLIHISEPTRLLSISYAVFCLKKKKYNKKNTKQS